MNQPYIHFYPRDWLAEYKLRMLSPADRGVWIDLLCLMAMAEPYGHLALNGKPMTDDAVYRILGVDVATYKATLARLVDVGVCSTSGNGEIYSRRMVRDYKRRMDGSRYGRKGGGNPDLRSEKNKKKAITITRETIKEPFIGSKSFVKPTAIEVTEYAKSINFELDGQNFIDYYEARGWKSKGSPIKVWMAAVRTWKKNNSGAVKSTGSRKPFPGEIMKQLDELRMQRKIVYNRHEVNGTIPADKPQAKATHSALCDKIKQLEKDLLAV